MLAQTHSVQSQDAEGVVDVRRQLEVDRGLGPGDLGEVVPVAPVVQRVLILDQKFCREQGKKTAGLSRLFACPRQHGGTYSEWDCCARPRGST